MPVIVNVLLIAWFIVTMIPAFVVILIGKDRCRDIIAVAVVGASESLTPEEREVVLNYGKTKLNLDLQPKAEVLFQ